MSLITRCPACTTMFKVVPDQLRVSDGWVRCGQCDEVFDANVHMQPALPVDTLPAPPPDTSVDAPVPFEAQVAQAPETEPALPQEQLVPPPVADAETAPAVSAVSDASPEDDSVVEAPESASMPPLVQAREAQFERYVSDPQQGVHPSFMRAKHRPSVWNKPVVRMTLALLCLVLGAVLALQVLLQERDRLAAMDPRLKPYLVSMCGVLDCPMAPWRQIDSVVIDSSSFVKVRADVYRLNLTLKNTADMEVASPVVELSLTDAQDNPVIRRVLSTAELAGKQGAMAPGSEIHASLPLHIKVPSGADRIAGYRLLAFYP